MSRGVRTGVPSVGTRGPGRCPGAKVSLVTCSLGGVEAPYSTRRTEEGWGFRVDEHLSEGGSLRERVRKTSTPKGDPYVGEVTEILVPGSSFVPEVDRDVDDLLLHVPKVWLVNESQWTPGTVLRVWVTS